MSTRSNIGIQKEDGTVEVIYCHFDGYPTGVGQELLDNYNSKKLAQDLVDLGNISGLCESLELTKQEAYSEKWKHDKMYQERTQDEEAATKYSSIKKYLDEIKGNVFIEYIYIYDCVMNQWYSYWADGSKLLLEREIRNYKNRQDW